MAASTVLPTFLDPIIGPDLFTLMNVGWSSRNQAPPRPIRFSGTLPVHARFPADGVIPPSLDFNDYLHGIMNYVCK